eukprot:g31979.t1
MRDEAGEGRWDGDRAQMLYKMVSESPLGLTNVEDATLGAVDAVHQVDRCAGETMSDVEVIRDGNREMQEGERGVGDGPSEFEVGVKGVNKVDELFKLLMGAQGSADTVINVAEEEIIEDSRKD